MPDCPSQRALTAQPRGGGHYAARVQIVHAARQRHRPCRGNHAATLDNGAFSNTVITVLIVGFAVFVLVKQANRLVPKAPDAPAGPPRAEVLLEEIRDLLRQKA